MMLHAPSPLSCRRGMQQRSAAPKAATLVPEAPCCAVMECIRFLQIVGIGAADDESVFPVHIHLRPLCFKPTNWLFRFRMLPGRRGECAHRCESHGSRRVIAW